MRANMLLTIRLPMDGVKEPPIRSAAKGISIVDTGKRFGETRRMRWMTGSATVLLLACLLGCARDPEPVLMPDNPNDKAVLLSKNDSGPIAMVFVPHPLADAAPGGVRRALRHACGHAPCTAAAFLYTEGNQAERWLLGECDRRRRAGQTPRVILAGHSLGATEAGLMARRLLADTDDVIIQMLVTVDAIKTGTVGTATGVSATVLTLGNPIPGKHVYFIAYDGAPRVDGVRLLAHVNYYHLETKLYHGAPMPGASENHLVQAEPAAALNHGNVDDYVYPMVLSDLRQALAEGSKP